MKGELQMKKSLQDLNLTDDIFFTLLMQQENFCRQVLSIILNKEFTKITYQQVQKSYQNLPGYKSIRLDVYAEDKDHKIYNVEMQKQEKKDLPQRSRYYQSMLDVSNLLSGKEIRYSQLKDTYIIFITEQDLFGLKRYQYTFRNRCDEAGQLLLQDGTLKIFLNLSGQNPEETDPTLVAFLHYLKDTTDTMANENEKLLQLHEIVTQLKNDQGMEGDYMNLKWLEEEAKERGREEGLEKGWEEGLERGREEGLEKGLEKGREEGLEKGKINTFLLLYQDGSLDKETCAKKLNLTIEAFEKLIEENEN